MVKQIIFTILFTMLFIMCKGCNNTSNHSSVKVAKDNLNSAAVKKDSLINEERKSEEYESFTIDCGSGCAMVYDEVLRKINPQSVEIRYKVVQYTNEEIENEDFENYIFESDQNGNLRSIHLHHNPENILTDNSSLLRDDLLKIGRSLYNGKVSN